jgi:hypothetical protein
MRIMICTAALALAACGDGDPTGNNVVGNAAENPNATAAGKGSGPAMDPAAAANSAEPLATGRDLAIDLPGLGHPVGDGARFLCFRFDAGLITQAGYGSAAAAIERFTPELRDRGVGVQHRLEPPADRDSQLAACRAEAPASTAADRILLIALSGSTATELDLRRGDYALATTDARREPAQWVESYLNARLGRQDPASPSQE